MLDIRVHMEPLPKLPARKLDSHKGDFGRALIIGGSRGMSGAIALTGMAALRSGAGLVRLAVPDPCLETVASFEPSYMTTPLPADPQGRLSVEAREPLRQLAQQMACLAVGPGLGRSAGLAELVQWMYSSLEQPLVIDADGLNALAERAGGLPEAGGPRILTPHPGEFGRLCGGQRMDGSQRHDRALEMAQRHGVVIVLKGYRTLITDGQRAVRNQTGNPGMATGGTGDILTGVIAALVCQGLDPFDASHLGVHIHGLAGDLAAGQLGQVSLVARDLLDYLPNAFQQMVD